MFKRKLVMIPLFILLIVGIPFGVYYYLDSQTSTSTASGSKNNDGDSQKSGNAAISKAQDVEKGAEGENPFNESMTEPIAENIMMQYIHAMSHQKVSASEKWSYFRLTDDRVSYLLDQLEMKDYKHEKVYKDILTRWSEEDFSEVDHDHNEIWNLQDGSVGEAKGILSEKEEEAFIQKQNKESR
ncbi:hypothetical protein JOC86_002268 [Bacillus pakistanensis]|uniref:PRK06770 family protein n=1 Tax=Rossellomorea pakistanensis TaxID=992288 RepID=A0ABS2ND10_9BACI|nr:DUF6241 domain-containing protein [Bacillus pakistanensis]MBM7585726.1 hypothetical protein [Bacillus pakistanensis]